MRQGFTGLRVVTFEDRLSSRVADLIEQLGGKFWSPSPMRELPEPAPSESSPRQEGDVTTFSTFTSGMLDDLEPLRPALHAIIDSEAEVAIFLNVDQVVQVMQCAKQAGIEERFREAMKRTVIGATDPACREALQQAGLGFDFEPDSGGVHALIQGLSRSASILLSRKRSSCAAGVDTSRYRRVDVVWPADEASELADPWIDSPFMRACRREKADYTPVWFLRQAGRYQREYRELRSKVAFLDLCKQPELAAEVTLMAVDQLGVDAAIIFADILLIAEPMGVGLSFHKGAGPTIERPVRTGRDVDALHEVEPAESLDYVCQAIRITRQALKPDLPLIGFCGAPFTVASYLIEGGSSRNFEQTKTFMYRDHDAFHALMEKITQASGKYLNAQIDAGAQVVQLFDSWVGVLDEADYREFVLPHTRDLIEMIEPGTPIIYFGTDTATLLKAMRETGADVIGFDWRVNLAQAWATIGHDTAVQGNLDPVVLLSTPAEIMARAQRILDQVAGRPGHIFNVGHGILPQTPVDNVIALVDAVHEYGHKSPHQGG